MRTVSSTVIEYVLRDQVQESFNILAGREIRLESDRYSLKGHYVVQIQKGNIYIIRKVTVRT